MQFDRLSKLCLVSGQSDNGSVVWRGAEMTRRSGGRGSLPTLLWLSVALVLVGSACAKGRETTSSGPTAYNVFAQKFSYHGFPASFKTGNIQINFSNKETFSIVHEMIVAQLPAGK